MNIILEGTEYLRSNLINYLTENYLSQYQIEIVKDKSYDNYLNLLIENSTNNKLVIYDNFLFGKLIKEILDEYKSKSSIKECKDICKAIIQSNSFIVFINEVGTDNLRNMENLLYTIMTDNETLDSFFQIGKKADRTIYNGYMKSSVNVQLDSIHTLKDNMYLILSKIDDFIKNGVSATGPNLLN